MSQNDTLVFDNEKLKIAQDMLEDIKSDLTYTSNLIFDAITKISNAYGIDIVEADNNAIDLRMPEKLMIQCEDDTKFISDTLNNQIASVLAYIGEDSSSTSVSVGNNQTKQESVSGVTAEQGESKMLIEGPDGKLIEVSEEELKKMTSNGKLNINTQPATTVPPTTVPVTTVPPTTVAPTTVAPTTVPVTTVPPTTVAPTTVAPTTVPATTSAPTTVAPTTVPATTVPPTTVAPTTVPATIVPPTTVAPTTVPVTTVPPTTVAPTTVPATTVPPTTVAPTTVPATTSAPTTTPGSRDDLGTIVVENTTVPASVPENPITNTEVADTTVIQERVSYDALSQHTLPNTTTDYTSETNNDISYSESAPQYSSIPETGVGMKDSFGDYITPAAIGAAAGIAGMIAAKAMKKDKEEETEE